MEWDLQECRWEHHTQVLCSQYTEGENELLPNSSMKQQSFVVSVGDMLLVGRRDQLRCLKLDESRLADGLVLLRIAAVLWYVFLGAQAYLDGKLVVFSSIAQFVFAFLTLEGVRQCLTEEPDRRRPRASLLLCTGQTPCLRLPNHSKPQLCKRARNHQIWKSPAKDRVWHLLLVGQVLAGNEAITLLPGAPFPEIFPTQSLYLWQRL